MFCVVGFSLKYRSTRFSTPCSENVYDSILEPLQVKVIEKMFSFSQYSNFYRIVVLFVRSTKIGLRYTSSNKLYENCA